MKENAFIKWVRGHVKYGGKSRKDIDKAISKNQNLSNIKHTNYYIFQFFKFFYTKKYLSILSPVCITLTLVIFFATDPFFNDIFSESKPINLGEAMNSFATDLLHIFVPISDLDESLGNGIKEKRIDSFGTVNITLNGFSVLLTIFKAISFIGIYSIISFFYYKFFASSLYRRYSKVSTFDKLEMLYPYNYMTNRLIIGYVYDERSLDLTHRPRIATISDKGLRQNILIIGSISTGKTISALAQFVLQILYAFYDLFEKKCAALILDVKGNFNEIPKRYLKECRREDDLIDISLEGKVRLNFLHKPDLSPMEIASRMRTVLEMFAKSGGDDYFIEKAEITMAEIIKLKRVHSGYVTFEDIHDIITYEKNRLTLFEDLEARRRVGDLSDAETYDYISGKSYFENEFNRMDQKLREIIVSEVTRMTNPFISKKEIKDIFCPTAEEINFVGFKSVIEEGKIVIWNINGNKEKKLSKLVAAYMKIDWQEEVLNTLELPKDSIAYKRQKALICDEYQHYCTRNDADFISQSREANGVMIVATQSYSSLLAALKNDEQVFNMLIQSFINKIVFRTDDTSFTVKKIKEQLGKFEVEKISTSTTESARDSKADYVLGESHGDKKNLSTGITKSKQKEELFDESFLNRTLTEGKALCLLSDGMQLFDPVVVHLPRQHKEGRIKLIDPENAIFQWVDFRPDAISDSMLSVDFDLSPDLSADKDKGDFEVLATPEEINAIKQARQKSIPGIDKSEVVFTFGMSEGKEKKIEEFEHQIIFTPASAEIDIETGEYINIDGIVEEHSLEINSNVMMAMADHEVELISPGDDAVQIKEEMPFTQKSDDIDDDVIKEKIIMSHNFGDNF